jgi:hypothetical protein
LRLLKLEVQPNCIRDETLSQDIEYDEQDGEYVLALNESLRDVRFELELERVKHQAKQAADLVFDNLSPHCPRFVALVLQLNEETVGECIEWLEYLRWKQIDVFGNTTYAGHPVEGGTIEYHEPCSNVLRDLDNDYLLKYD